MTYLAVYFGAGLLVVGLGALVFHFWRDDTRPTTQEPGQSSPLWLWVLFVAVWPLLLAMLLYWFATARRTATTQTATSPIATPSLSSEDDGHALKLTPEDLVEQLTVGEIEAREMITDPLGAVPAVPFGHLNCVWRKFLDGYTESDQLWSFAKRRRSQTILTGYAKVRDGEVVSHMVQTWKHLADE